jgi:phosphotransferase system  glucose/maltose/N-acetylglucosamine-specific IIC component
VGLAAIKVQTTACWVALVEAGSLIGSSFIISAAINGWDISDPPYATTIIFFVTSQIFLFLFQLIFEAVTKYDDEKEKGDEHKQEKANEEEEDNQGLFPLLAGIF